MTLELMAPPELAAPDDPFRGASPIILEEEDAL